MNAAITNLILMLGTCATLAGCQNEPADPATATETFEMPDWITHPDGSLEIEFSDLRFLLPADRKYFSVLPFAREPGGGLGSFSRVFRWPGLADTAADVSDDPAVNRERRVNTVMLRVNSDGRAFAAQQYAGRTFDPDHQLAPQIERLEGPFTSATPGLLEYRTPQDGRPVIYVPADPSVLRPNGARPWVSCPAGAPPEIRWCESGAPLSPYVSYGYEFTDKWLGDWLEMDLALRTFVDGLIVKP